MKKLLIFLMIAIPLVIVIIVNLTVNAVVGTVSIAVDEVRLNKDEIIANIDDIVTLKATIYPASATNKDVIWESDNEDVAQVDLNGNVTFVGFGNGYITVTTVDGKKKASCYFYITDTKAHQVVLTSPQKEIPLGDNIQLRATVLPDEALDKGVTFESSDESIARVDANGVVYGVGVGYVTITATTDDGGYSSYIILSIINPVTSLTVTQSEVVTSAGYYQIGYSIYPLNASNKTVEFFVDNTSIATVNTSGMVSFKKAGVVNVTLKTVDGGFTQTVKITNTDGYAADLLLNEYLINASIGDTPKYIEYTTVPTNIINTDVEFLTSDSKVAYVDESGYLQFVGGGSATITARIKKTESEYISKNILVYVESPAESIVIQDTIITAQKQIRLEPESYPSNSTNNNFYYQTLDKNIATVNEDGLVEFINNSYSTVKIIIYANENYSDIKKTVTVIYTGGYATDFSLNEQDITLEYGQSYKLNYTVEPQNTVYQDITYNVIEQNGINSNDVIKVLSDGTIVTLGGGDAVIEVSLKTAQNNIVVSRCSVNVIRKVENIDINLSLDKQNEEYITSVSTVSFGATTVPLDVQDNSIVWSVSDSKIAVIVGNTFKFNYIGVVTLYAKSKDGGAISSVNIRYVGPSPIEATVNASYKNKIVKIPTTMYVGDSFDVVIDTVTPSNAVYKNITLKVSNQITLSPTNEVLTVQDNRVTALAGGTATLSIYVSTGVQIVYDITVIRNAESITVQPSNIETTKSSIVLNATVLPEDVTDKTVTYYLEETNIATIKNNLLTFTDNGTVKITAVSNSNPSVDYTFTITKVENGSSTIDPTVESIELVVGDSFVLDFSSGGIIYENFSIKIVDSVSLESGDVIAIKDNLITALGLGNATVECYLYDEYGTNVGFYSITINVIQLAEQILLVSNIDQYNGEYITAQSEKELLFDVLPINATNKDVTIKIESSYTSSGVSSEHVAYIQDNKIVFIQAGTVNILVQSVKGDATSTYRIRYTGGDALSAELNLDSVVTLEAGESVTVDVTRWIPFDVENNQISIKEISHTQGVNVVSIVNNTITALAGGTSKLLIELSNGSITKDLTINVINKVQQIQIQNKNILTANNIVTLSATALPSTATNRELTYTIENNDIATISDRTVTFTRAGSVKVYIRTVDGSNLEEIVTIISTMECASEILLNYTNYSVNKGLSFNLYPKTVYPLDVANYKIYYQVQESNTIDGTDNQVISVDEQGVVKGLYGGSAVIRAYTYDYYGNVVYADCIVSVVNAVVDINVNFGNIEYYQDMIITSKTQLEFDISVTPTDATNREFDYVISDKNIAGIVGNTIMFYKAGTVDIKFISKDTTYGEKSKTFKFFCTYNQLMQAEIDTTDFAGSPKSLTMNAGETYTFNIIKTIPADFDSAQFVINSLVQNPILNNTNVISFEDGVINAINGGDVSFELYLNNISLGNFKITVMRYATSIEVDETEAWVSVPTYKINAKAYPFDTQQSALAYSIDNPSIAQVLSDGYVEFFGLGTVKVKVSLVDNPNIYTYVTIEYTKQIKELLFYDTATQMYVSDYISLSTYTNPLYDEDYNIIWTASNPELVTLKVDGTSCKILGKTPGTVDITATVEGTDISVTRTFTIYRKLSDIVLELISKDDERGIGGYRVFGNMFIDTDGNITNTYLMKIKSARDTAGAVVINPDQTIDGILLEWTSSNTNIATVSPNGLVTFVGGTGKVTITVAQQKPYEGATAKYTSYTFNVVKGVNVYNIDDMINIVNQKEAVVLQSNISYKKDSSIASKTIELYNNMYGNGYLVDMNNMTAGTKVTIKASNVIVDNVTLRGATFGENAALSELRSKGRVLTVNNQNNVLIQNTTIENAMICAEVKSAEVTFAGCIIRNSFSGGLIITKEKQKQGSHVIARDTIFARSLLSSVILQPFAEDELGEYLEPCTFEMQNNVYIYNWITLDEFQIDTLASFIPEDFGFENVLEDFVADVKKIVTAQNEFKYVYNNKEYYMLGVLYAQATTPIGTFKSYGTTDKSALRAECNYIDGNINGKINVVGAAIPITFNLDILTLRGNVLSGNEPFIKPGDTYENINIAQAMPA